MPTPIPSFMQNTPTAPKKPFPSTSNDSVHPKRSKMRMLLFIIALLAIGGIIAYYFVSISDDDSNSDLIVATSNSNQNVNQNINTTTVINSNVNQNSNLNTNQNTNSSEDEYDTDGDYVQDHHELLFDMDINITDTDGDGYDDFTEIIGYFNPIGDGRISTDNYLTYCKNYFNMIAVQIPEDISNDMIVELCTLWVDDIAIEISNKINNIDQDVFNTIYSTSLTNTCAAIDDKYTNIKIADEMSLCEYSLMIASGFSIIIDGYKFEAEYYME